MASHNLTSATGASAHPRAALQRSHIHGCSAQQQQQQCDLKRGCLSSCLHPPSAAVLQTGATPWARRLTRCGRTGSRTPRPSRPRMWAPSCWLRCAPPTAASQHVSTRLGPMHAGLGGSSLWAPGLGLPACPWPTCLHRHCQACLPACLSAWPAGPDAALASHDGVFIKAQAWTADKCKEVEAGNDTTFGYKVHLSCCCCCW